VKKRVRQQAPAGAVYPAGYTVRPGQYVALVPR